MILKINKIAFLLYFLLIPFGIAVSIISKKTSVPILISVIIKDIKTPNGQILMGIYKDDVSFDKELPYKKVQAFKNSLLLIEESPSPLPVLETINRSKLKTIKAQTIATGIVTYNELKIVCIAKPIDSAAIKPVAKTTPPIPTYFTRSE